jgi:hypothetical protein
MKCAKRDCREQAAALQNYCSIHLNESQGQGGTFRIDTSIPSFGDEVAKSPNLPGDGKPDF